MVEKRFRSEWLLLHVLGSTAGRDSGWEGRQKERELNDDKPYSLCHSKGSFKSADRTLRCGAEGLRMKGDSCQ
ncbi:hypothetical protein ACFRCQ_07390 [Cytobacillus firmus]|uniref:hypothetical protein n=1 Tax=Cytobacillus firmus TaxID=1399 RepID=UPI003697DE6A